MENNREIHDSFGVLKFSRVNSNTEKSLFGSSIKHSNTIVMTVSKASVERQLNRDWVSDEGKILECEMSYAQFAEAITSMNVGVGTPVTLRRTELKPYIESCELVNKREQFEKEFKRNNRKQNETTNKLIEEVIELFERKKTFNKSDKENVIELLHQLKMAIGCNQEFIYEQFNRQMDKTVAEAKGEIEAFVQNKINALGVDGLKGSNNMVLNIEDKTN